MAHLPRPAVLVLAVLLVLLTSGAPISAQGLAPIGDQFQVNVVTADDQDSPAVAVGPDGRFLIAWRSVGQIGPDGGIVSRRFTAAGDPDGGELPLNSDVDFDQEGPLVSIRSDGYVVGWAGKDTDAVPQPEAHVKVARVAADGTPAGTITAVETLGFITFDPIALAVAPDDAFFAAWTVRVSDVGGSIFVRGRLFDPMGTPAAGEVTLPTSLGDVFGPFQFAGGVAAAAGGGYFAVWTHDPGFNPGPEDVRGRRVDGAGSPVGGEVTVSTPGQNPAIAALPGDRLVVVWQADQATGSGNDVLGRLMAVDGSPLGPIFRVNDHTPGEQTWPQVAAAPDGGFVVVWESETSAGDDASGTSVQARWFAPGGAPTGFDLQVNHVTAGDQLRPRVAMAPDHTMVVVWGSASSAGDDASGNSVQGRRLAPPAPPGPISYWRAEGDALDSIGINPGQLAGGTGFVAGQCGQAFSLDGVDDSVEIADHPTLDAGEGDLSWALRVRTSAAAGLISLLDKRTLPPTAGYHLFLLDGRPGIQLADGAGFGNAIAAAGVADGAWHHLAFTVDRDRADGGRIYIDGQLALTFDPTPWPGPLTAASALSFGRRSDDAGGGAHYPGDLDEVIFVRRALRPVEVYGLAAGCTLLFADDFEDGHLGAWTRSVP